MKFIKNNNGISVVLSVLVLAALVGLVITVANISFRITKSSESISDSELAFYAAETAAELTIYEIEKNDRGLDLPDLNNQPLSGTNATWSRQVTLETDTPGLCSAPQRSPACTVDAGPVDTNNPLEITLDAGQSLQMEFNISLALYPSRVEVSWPGNPSTRVIVFGPNGQTTETTSPVLIPEPTDQLGGGDDYRVRIINDSSGSVTYKIKPIGGGGDLPLGLNISATGVYKNSERRLEITRPSWLIY